MNAKQDDFARDWRDTVREIEGMVFDMQSFISATFKFKEAIGPEDNAELKIRTAEVRGKTIWQFTKGPESQNLSRSAAKRTLGKLLYETPVDQAHVTTGEADLHCRIAKKGRVLVSRSKLDLERDVAKTRSHDRQKDYPLTRFDSAALLRVLGFTDSQGSMKPSMHAKYRQVNEFLRIVETTLADLAPSSDAPLNLVDVGCGKAYLSFAAKAYLEATAGVKICFTGIDVRESAIASCRRMADALGWTEDFTFVVADIADFKAKIQPDIVMSLHACDTATDEALAFGVESQARAILCAPCCQHELQSKLGTGGPHQAILRNGILKERLADILTDAFRAQILRVMGYKTQVVEFIDQQATARNILIRATRASRVGMHNAVGEYQALREAWGCTPFLAERLAAACSELVES
ncbi:MAG: class I SAM-dependent methyltransferase [Kiritimatiellia bacterium]|jgi:SAM-dependent methyltransferase|uniref:class I SAM-dependent methyltransferase n=1 Tax=Atribacter sp. TaxID=2847780 RepID=UPI003D9694A1